MKVLLVVPKAPDLNIDDELQDWLSSGLQITPLLGHVGQREVVRAIRDGDEELLAFLGHSNMQGILLSDGLLGREQLAPLVRGYDDHPRFDYVFLNSCESDGIAYMLQKETDATVIATILEVPDITAYQTGALFAQVLGRTGNVRSAFEASRPGGDAVYVMFAGKKTS